MAFEHEQFHRFLQNECQRNKQHECHSPPSPSPNGSSSTGGRSQSRPLLLQQQHQQLVGRRGYCSAGKKVSWSTGDGQKRCEPLTPQGRVAALVVCLKLALLCAWLIHELASGFDESHCLLMAASNSSQSHHQIEAEHQRIAQQPEQQQLMSTRNGQGNGKPASSSNSTDIKVIRWQIPGKEKQQSIASTSPKAEETPATMSDERNERIKDELSSLSSESANASQQQSMPQSPVPKRRRKVILRRRLVQKGATGAVANIPDVPQQKPKGGAVRRVVWRVVPLQKLPSPSSSSSTSVGQPMRTKTGTVMLRRRLGEEELGGGGGRQKLVRRRIARRRTAGLDMAPSRGEPMTAWQRGGPPADAMDDAEAGRPKLAIYAAASLPEQLDVLVGSTLCYARSLLDCWCLVQCFCSALFLLGLHIRHRLLAMVPVVVDMVSIVLALIFGISTLMFPLMLLLLLPNSPGRPLLQCLGLSALVHLAIALFAWATFLQLKAVNTGGSGAADGKGQSGIGSGRRRTNSASAVGDKYGGAIV